MSQGAQSIDRAAELLSLVIRADQPVTYTDLVETTGLARSTVSRLLAALERNGLLERTRDGAFRGGAMFTYYATRFDRVEALVAVAQPYLERVAEHTGETVNLGVPRGDTVVHAVQIDSKYRRGGGELGGHRRAAELLGAGQGDVCVRGHRGAGRPPARLHPRLDHRPRAAAP